ncbi:hypothetical protein [Lysobacter sp. HA35]
MSLARILVAVAFAALAGNALAARPSEAELSIAGETCQQEGARTLLAYRGRESGIPESTFNAQLPAITTASTRYVVAAHRILADVYRLRDLSDDTLYFYQFQVCRVESITGADIETTRSIEKALRACEAKGTSDKDALQACTFKAVLAAIPG